MKEWPAHVEIREVGPRDGLQNEAPVPVAERVRLIDALSRTGLPRIEAAAFVSPTAIPPMVGAEEVMAGIDRVPGVVYSALVPNSKGAERAIAARADEIEVVVALARGVTPFDASIGGLGGCPYAPGASGNAVTEDLVHMCHDMGIETGIDLDALVACAVLASEIVGKELPSALLHAGPRSK